MKNQNLNLKIGDKIGFTFLASDVDSSDETLFFPVIELTERDGETAYFVQFLDGARNRSAIKQSDLAHRAVQIEPVVEKEMICLSDRKDEFVEALERGKKSNLEVFGYWDKDTFIVVNHDNEKEYSVNLKTVNNSAQASCSCPDFSFRKRICKHLVAVLIDTMLTVKS